MAAETYKARTHYQQTKVAEGYEQERFSAWHGRVAHRWEMEALKTAMQRHFGDVGSILDLPCGTGRLLRAYDTNRFAVTGGDVSDQMLAVSRKRFSGDPSYTFVQCDAERLHFEDESFDYLVSFRLMCHLPEETRLRVLGEMARVTRKVLIVNYHFDVRSPLMLLNKLLRRQAAYLPYPLREADLRGETVSCGSVEILEVKKLSLWERSSALVIFRKRSGIPVPGEPLRLPSND